MKSRAWIAARTVLIAVLLFSGFKAVAASAAFLDAASAGESTGLVVLRSDPVRAPATGPLTEIARAERALVFIYSPDCAVCHANMVNWIDLVADLRDGPVRLYAVAPMDTPAARAYWGSMSRYVRVVTATPATVHRAFVVEGTPTTLLVERGVVRGEIVGALTAAAIAQIRGFAATGEVPEAEQ
ncbi:MAG: hypothetical protein LC667_21170 [Thioalkalivibrio sp.]|nr:hypothetical protein [Thioalkalivibrio sp.]